MPATHAPVVIPVGRALQITPSADCRVSISGNASGDATIDHKTAILRAGRTYIFNSSGGAGFMDGIAPDGNTVVNPAFVNAGPAGTVG